MEQILNMTEPFINGLPHHAFYLSVMGNNRAYKNWFFSNFVQITCNKHFLQRQNPGFDFYQYYDTCPYLEISSIPKDILLKSQNNLICFFKNCIDSGYYLYVFLDEFYINDRPSTNQEHCWHDNLIFGYNDTKAIFNIAGYNEIRKYTFTETSHETLLNSFVNAENLIYPVRLLKSTQKEEYQFNSKYVVSMLEDYYYSKNTSEKLAMFYQPQDPELKAFGLETYDYLALYLQAVAEKKVVADFRPFYLLEEHKKCMVKRLEYMSDNDLYYRDDIVGMFEQILRCSGKWVSMLVKYLLTKDRRVLGRLQDSLLQVKNREKEVIGLMLSDL